MTTWEEHANRGNLTVKGRRANGHQAENMAMIVSGCVRHGSGDIETCAGAIATAIQESSITNIQGGDRDSLGLYQQRPSMGWGSASQIMDRTYAINKFLSLYVPYRKQGLGWLQASHKTQRSAHPNAPAAWYGESVTAAKYYRGSASGVVDATGSTSGDGTTTTITREKPYEFARGSVDQREDSWSCKPASGDWQTRSVGGATARMAGCGTSASSGSRTGRPCSECRRASAVSSR